MKTQIQGTHVIPSKHSLTVRFALAFAVIALLLTAFAPRSHGQTQPPGAPIFWLDADQSVTQTLYQDQSLTIAATDGSPVAGWKDKSGNNWHVFNPAEYSFQGLDDSWKPIYRVNQHFGKPAVRFEVHNVEPAEWDFLKTTSPSVSLQGTSYTFFVVARWLAFFPVQPLEGLLSIYSAPDGDSQGDWDSIAGPDEQHATPTGVRVGHRDEPTGSLTDGRNAKDLSAVPLPSAGVPFLYCSKFDGVANTAYLNGVAGTPVVNEGTSGNFSAERIQLGAMSGWLVPAANCDIFEVLIYAGSLSDAERVAVEQYLNNKWAYVGAPSGVSLTVSAHTTQESYLTPVQVNVTRPDTQGDLTVNVALGGTATYGVDYLAFPWDGSGTVTIPNGANSVSFGLYLIPDSRAEGGETVTATIQTGSYTILAPSTQNITIVDDDLNQMPPLGWKITDLGQGTTSYARGINTLVGGAQAVGHSDSWSYYGYVNMGFRHYNGYETWLFPTWSVPSGGWAASAAAAINNNGVSVGYQRFYDPYHSPNYGHQACLWKNDQYGTPVALPDLGPLLLLTNAAVDINNRDDLNQTGGVIVGNNVLYPSAKIHAVAWIPDANGNYHLPNNLGDLGSGFQNSFVSAINNNAIVVGKSQHSVGTSYHAFRSTEQNNVPDALSPFHDMGTATGNDAHASEGNDINDLGELVGASQSPVGQYRAMYKSPSSAKNQGWYDLGVLGTGNWSAAYGINGQGLIVGQSKTSGAYQTRAFVAGNAGNPGSQPMLELTGQAWVKVGYNWFTAASQGWTLISAERINENNWIVGWGTKSGQTRAFMLSPR